MKLPLSHLFIVSFVLASALTSKALASQIETTNKATSQKPQKPKKARQGILNASQSPSTPPIIKEVRYDGLHFISPLIANEIAQIQIGERLNIRQIDKAILNFYKQGYFSDIWVGQEDGILTFYFTEKPIIASLVLSGYGAGKDQAVIDKEIGLKKGDVYDEIKINNTKKNIIKLLEKQGFYDSVVEVKKEEISPNALKVTLEVNQGEEIIIKKANYYGRKNLGLSRLESVSANKERDFLGWMWGFNDGKLNIAELDNDPLRIRDIYLQKGYLDAEVSKPFVRTDFTTYKAELDMSIQEGKVYKVSEIDLILEDPIIEEELLRKKIALQLNKPFNIQTMRKDIQTIELAISDLGYAFTRVTPDLDKDEENAQVRVIYYVQPGQKVKIRDVVISGNTRTLDKVIRRNVLLGPGDEYQKSKIQNSKNAIMRSGAFENVEIEEKRIDSEHLDLLVNVKEAKTGEFTFGVGYGSFDGLMGSVSVKDRNIFGTGLTAGIYFDKSEVSTSYRLNLYNPAVLDSPYSLSTDVYQTDYTDFDYTEKTQGGSIIGGRKITETLEANLGYTYQRSQLSNFNNPFYLRYYKGTYVKSSIIPGFSFDNTDSYFFAKNGWRINASLEFAGVGGDAEFTKYYGKLNFYHSLQDYTDLDVIFRYRSNLGYARNHGYLPINEKFYLGGVSTLRGYQSNSISPRDQFNVRVGGKQVFYHSVELSYGLFETVQMRIAAFYDYGMLGEKSFSQITRSSAGAAIEWISPLGPITFILPKAINPRKNDRTSSFEFTMGQQF